MVGFANPVTIIEIKPAAGCETAISRTPSGISFEFPEAWVTTSRLDHCLLAWCAGISEGKERICS